MITCAPEGVCLGQLLKLFFAAESRGKGFTYDDADRLTAVTNPRGQTTALAYDLAGRRVRLEHGNGAITSYTYDCADRLRTLTHTASDDTLLKAFTYSYDQAGNRRGVVESTGAVTTWSYDKTYQLLREARSASPAYSTSYSYDAADNRLTQNDSGAVTSYTYDEANRLLTAQDSSGVTTYSYDEDGNRTQKETPSELTVYTWDEDSRLTSAEPVAGLVTLSYRADGRRVQKETPSQSTHFIYDLKRLLQETDDAGDPLHEYTSTLDEWGELVSEYDETDTLYHQYDALGSTDALLDDDEALAASYAHRAFGLEAAHSGTAEMPFTFVGAQNYYRDPELALYFAGARYYDPAAGRWMSADPIGFQAGDENLFRYVGNNPVNRVDPSGLQETLGPPLPPGKSAAESKHWGPPPVGMAPEDWRRITRQLETHGFAFVVLPDGQGVRIPANTDPNVLRTRLSAYETGKSVVTHGGPVPAEIQPFREKQHDLENAGNELRKTYGEPFTWDELGTDLRRFIVESAQIEYGMLLSVGDLFREVWNGIRDLPNLPANVKRAAEAMFEDPWGTLNAFADQMNKALNNPDPVARGRALGSIYLTIALPGAVAKLAAKFKWFARIARISDLLSAGSLLLVSIEKLGQLLANLLRRAHSYLKALQQRLRKIGKELPSLPEVDRQYPEPLVSEAQPSSAAAQDSPHSKGGGPDADEGISLGSDAPREIDLGTFSGKTLHSGIEIESVETAKDLTDVIGRPATGHTSRVGKKLKITIKEGLTPEEQSITIYHELIEGAMGAHFPDNVPKALQELNEVGIDELAKQFHEMLGPASVSNLNKALKELGF